MDLPRGRYGEAIVTNEGEHSDQVPSDEDDGIKKLTTENWLEGDDILKAFVRLDATGRRSALTKEVLAERFLSIDLSEEVPSKIQTLYRTARGVLLYGYFFYPLYVVGLGEISRTAEAAITRKFKELRGPKKSGTFAARLEWLHEAGHLTDKEKFIWDTIRRDRNETAHPSYQMVQPPADLVRDLRVTAHCINCLFDRSIVFESLWEGAVRKRTSARLSVLGLAND